MRLKSVSLQDFRSFSSGKVDMSADVVVIYGRNGSGKTTIFDAIEFALFGSVARLGSSAGDTDYIARVGGTDVPRVRVDFQDGGEASWVETRSDRSGRRTPSIRGSASWPSHRDLLYDLLVDEGELQGRREVASVREMFRATLFMSQYSIREFVEGGAEDRARRLAWLAGLGHIQRAKEKTARVAALLERQWRDQESERLTNDEELGVIRTRLAELHAERDGIRSRLGGTSSTLAEARRALTEIGISVPPELTHSSDDVVTAARVLQAHCDQQRTEVDIRSRRLASVESGMRSHAGRVERLARLELERRTNQDELAQRDTHYTELVSLATSRLAAHSEASSRASEAAEELRRVRAHVELSRTATSVGSQLVEARGDLVVLAERRESLVRAIREQCERCEKARLREQQARSDFEENQNRHEAVGDIARRLSLQAERANEIEAKRQRLESSIADLQALEEAIKRARARKSYLREALAKVEVALSRVQSESAEREQILSRLRSITHGDTCPLCGTPHESESSLIEAINTVLSRVPETTRVLAEKVQSERATLVEVSSALNSNEERHAEMLQSMAALKATLETYDAEEEAIEALALNLDLHVSESSILTELSALRDREVASSAALQAAKKQAREDEERIGLLKKELNDCEEQMTAKEQSFRKLEELDEDVRRRLREHEKHRDTKSPETTLAAEVDRMAAVATELERGVEEAASAHRHAEERVQAAGRERAELARVVKSLDDEISTLGADIQGFRSQLREAGLEFGVSNEVLQERRATLDAHEVALARCRELAEKAGLQASLDSVLTECETQEAHLREVERDASKKAAVIQKLMRAQEVVRSWAQPLELGLDTALEKTIRAYQREIERHFKAMIPAPHLYESIVLRRVGSRVQLGVKYRGQATESGEPRVFLSNAQLNLLALAIFLSMGARQRWSRLQSLLLDDPIQHLDDLDAVAFLDTLRAVALGRLGEKRQIVISTCDRNLFRLMIQKFEPLQALGTSFAAVTLAERGGGGPEILPYRLKDRG